MFFIIFFIGAIFGSFASALSFRLPNKIGFVCERSICPKCQHPLAPKDLVPVFSWLFLKRKCRYCSNKISCRYIIAEIFNGFIAIALWQNYLDFRWFLLALFASSLATASIFIIFENNKKYLQALALLAFSAFLFLLTEYFSGYLFL